MKFLGFIVVLLISSICFSQKQVVFTFELDHGSANLTIDQLRYYISSVKLSNNKTVTFTEQESYHLLDHSDSNSLSIRLEIPEDTNFDQISFNVGVDSAKNMKGVHGGDLDPTKGMYWTWQSGYINFKLEANVNNHSISYHIGGFMHPNNACREVQLPLNSTSDHFVIKISPEKLLDQLDYRTIHHVMSPGHHANLIADLLPSLFSVK
ncbi:MbnP family protein [Parvicella tangerina]|uniref:Copper-binding protein MbnP-like domain-containing protein n=1 Tax=Parvicella tangerina TaxID=2829795 RepID=A0A916JL15_9FLAO|nr:MbnP family protein [Parvicella tangerina]CAG5079288.1 hypothetical protein CRYO30217_00907 [Parvicella tangerina]